ncbi:MAG: hypothetical protein PHR83_03730 [Paludibacter sp.]|nr:hypothetical protein [Paludibacter sp.]
MKKVLFILFLFFTVNCFSQTKNIEQYLDDGGRTASSDIIKMDISQFFLANIPLIWEHRFGEHFSLQSGVGLLTHSSFRPLITPLFAQDPLYAQLMGGYSLFLQPTYYSDGFESFHIGVSIKYRKHGNQVSSHEYSFNFGKQWFLGRHLSVDLETGLGLNYERSLDGTSYIYIKDITNNDMTGFNSRIVFPISLKIGYVL